jgi:aminoglycoside phosphotransferase (APT) family kinase protein
MRWLDANAPVSDRITVVHGDYRVGNFLRQGGRITAILDWELVHLGDPHEDLAWAGLRAFSPGSRRVGGLIDLDVFHSRYSASSGFAALKSHGKKASKAQARTNGRCYFCRAGARRRNQSN